MSGTDSDSKDAPGQDLRLLADFAQRGDSSAFEALVQAHQDSIFDLARRIVGDDSLADDVAQETFLSLYRKPPVLKAGLNVRFWLLGVARHQALERLRVNARRKSRESNYAMKRSDGKAENKTTPMPISELQQALNTLPEEFQVPVALYYLHGLRRAEVAALLKVPDGTIASRIARGLEQLRAMLEGKGRTVSAAAGIVALEAGLKELPLAKAPATIGALEVIQKLDAVKVATKSVRHASRLARLAPKAGGVVILSIAAAVAAACGGIWWNLHVQPASAPAVQVPAAPAVEKKAAASDALHVRWSFENVPAKDIEVMQGTWQWQPGENNNPGAMATPLTTGPGDTTALLLLVKIPQRPFVLTLRTRLLPDAARYRAGANWCDVVHQASPNQRDLFLRPENNMMNSTVQVVDVIFTGRFSVSATNKIRIDYVREYETPYPESQVYVAVQNVIVESIELRGLRPEEIPEDFRDPRALAQKLERGDPIKGWDSLQR